MTDKHGLTALQWAAGGGHLAVVDFIVQGARVHSAELVSAGTDGTENGSDSWIDGASKDGRTALMWACRNGHLAVCERLVSAVRGKRIASCCQSLALSGLFACWFVGQVVAEVPGL